MPLGRGDLFGDDHELINLMQRQIGIDGWRFALAIFALIIIEIAISIRRHNDIVASAGGRDPALAAAPAHDRRFGRQSAFQDLVPTDQPATALAEPAVKLAHEPALQLIFIGQILRFDARLAIRAGFPTLFWRFVGRRCG